MTRLDEADEIYVEVIDFGDNPGREMVTQNSDGSYTVLINARIAYDQQQDSLRHAVEHIEDCDFEKSDVQEIEMKAHRKGTYGKNGYIYEGVNRTSGSGG